MTRPSSSSRPYTSSGHPASARPTTSRADHPDYFDRDQQYTAYSQDYSVEDEDEESEAEDVFAFGPPGTAEAEPHAVSTTVPPSLVHPPVSFPPPAFDPHATYPNFVMTGPSSLHTRHPYPMSPQVETPPSTDSQTGDDPYRMRRVAQTNSTSTSTTHTGTAHAGRRSAVSSAVSSREVHISLPRTKDRIEEEQPDDPQKSRPPSSVTSFPSLDSGAESIKMEFDFDGIEEEDSPYPEVRASVSNIDDPEMPCLTMRMWFIGMLLILVTGSANVFFNFRQPAPAISTNVILLCAHPLGKLFAFFLPITTYRFPRWLGGLEFSLNPGPWNIKEHACVFMMANVASGAPYAINAVVVAEIDYGRRLSYGFSVLLVMATQMTGFGVAGLCRRVLVWPASMIWPQNLVTCTVLNTLHAEEDEGRGGISRYRYFMYVVLGAFFFFFLPGYLFTALSIFSWICWIRPNNIPVNQLFGVANGLGMGIVTFDWTQITWAGNPLMVPWWASIQTFAGFVFFYWIILPTLYYTNTWHLAHLPMLANTPYDRYAQPYNVSRVLNSDQTLNVQGFNDYSPLYLPGGYAVTYLIAFILSSCVIVHTILYYGKNLMNGFKRIKIEKDDIHAKLMRSYPEVPDWWYLGVFAVFLALMIVAQEVWQTGLPVWALLLSLALPVLYTLPAGFIFATSGQSVALNLLAQIIPGGLLPGKPIANMIFKGYTIQTLAEALSFVQDLKLGHYIKVPPRATFIVQSTATLFAAFIQVGVKQWMFSSIPDICQPDQRSRLTCPHNQVYYTASAIWGLLGPSRQFGKSSIYYPQVYAVIVGVFLPIPFWYWQRKYPNSWNTYISTPIALNAVTYVPPATGINYSSWITVGFIFQYWIRRRNFAWWSKFNYVTSAALDIGTFVSLLFIFFTLQFPRGGSIQVNWWGNSVWERTADFLNLPLRQTSPEGF
ncbi:uncharacterized protein PHACADRAFT_259684 [Phanerochaete carnosa HHB-10118-sp]|uniref:Oligopeptide transporter n=1 Tax=Phanerochaete carnosa (strain HHB-10118-sp) TaxID=650164 RepID=K5W377_PHACS|nr:uncharacterized protein PHACADRAFT_259684 [Phanerochaete carnosa HHB-10118-sp]EKM53364.1 hypothetical protein PHACADRAFT_259684 [Phanerochaete carnosa HHB-10118-sp]